ncbi:hypothetical protein MRI28_17210 [Nocardiopsis dassonvillei]|uniref:hypothetical protein n=1 Tax=Nocardiopsis dassonvillei TaxID=2014 RepID=UPI00200BE7D0|nr:hypothetical protein [Nocardiopsis dassonvillei]MCK9871355.1 hypothetical protein [Nocardiopsis dassonvillei]
MIHVPDTFHRAGVLYHAGVLEWYDTKLGQVTDLIMPTLLFIGFFVVLLSYLMFRSWKKAAVAAIGMAIVIAIVNSVTGLSSLVEGEFASSPSSAAHQQA